MITLELIRENGFIIKPASNASLYIEPFSELSDSWRQWLISNKTLIHQQLMDERWQWFLSLATEHCIHQSVIGAEFPTEADKLDVIQPIAHTDQLLHRCMATLCSDQRIKQRQSEHARNNKEKYHAVC